MKARSDGGILNQTDPHRADPELIPEQPPGTRGQVFRRVPSAVAGAADLDSELIRRLNAKLIPERLTGDEKALQVVVAVRALAQHPQPQIQLQIGIDGHSREIICSCISSGRWEMTGEIKDIICRRRASASGMPRLRR